MVAYAAAMARVIDAVRMVHIAAGFAALLIAPVAMVSTKGGPAHRRWGRFYYRAMTVVAVSALLLTFARPNLFLTMVAVLSFYAAFLGYRAITAPGPRRGRGQVVDWGMALITLAASTDLVVLGVLAPSAWWRRMAIVSVVLGTAGVALAGRAIIRMLWPPKDPRARLFTHMIGMLTSYIATLTAFSVVNFTLLPVTVRWLWPTALGVPLMQAWVAFYRRRLDRRVEPAAIVAEPTRP